jgi:hypothetical protein
VQTRQDRRFAVLRSVYRVLRGLWSARWPLSVRILAVVAVLFVLQAIPFTGVFLMIVGAPFWSIPLVTLAVLVAGFEGLTGRARSWVVLVPVAWFGLYALAVMREEAALVTAEAMVADANAAAVAVAFDPARQDVVVDEFVDTLLIIHRLPVVYIRPRPGRKGAMEAARLAAGSLCETLADRKTGVQVTVRPVPEMIAQRHGLGIAAPVCIVSFEEPATRQIIDIRQTRADETVAGLSVAVTTVSAESAEHRAAVDRASTALLQRFPMPVIGCALNSGAPSWDCFAGFMRRSSVRFGAPEDDADALARILDLSSTPPRPPVAAGNGIILARLAAADARLDRWYADLIERLLSEPASGSPSSVDVRQLERDPSRLVPHADRLIAALEVADARQRGADETNAAQAIVLARLLALLPDAVIRRHGDRILALLDGPPGGWQRSARPLLRRTAVLGFGSTRSRRGSPSPSRP